MTQPKFQIGDRVWFAVKADGRNVATVRGTVQYDPATRPVRPSKQHDPALVDVVLDGTRKVYSIARERLELIRDAQA